MDGQVDMQDKIRQLSKESEETNDVRIKIEKIFSIALIYYDYFDDPWKADSISQIGLTIARQSHIDRIHLMAYNKYLESNDVDEYYNTALAFCDSALKICSRSYNSDLEWSTFHNTVNVYLSRLHYDKALNYSLMAKRLADLLNDNSLKVQSAIDIARSLEGDLAIKDQKKEALLNYLYAIEIAEKVEDPALMKKAYSAIAAFFGNSKFDTAVTYKKKQLRLIEHNKPVDSVEYMWCQYDFQWMHNRLDKSKFDEKMIYNIIDFANRVKNYRLKNYTCAIFRVYLINNEKTDELYNFYYRRYPHDLKILAVKNPTLYYRLEAFFKEKEKKNDSAIFFFRLAEMRLLKDSNLINRSQFNNRYGQFLVRNHMNTEAILKFNISYNLARQSRHFIKFEYMLNSIKELESLYFKIGDFQKAYSYAAASGVISDSITNINKKEQLLILQLNQTAELQKQKKDRTIRQQKTERDMAAGVVLIFILLSYVIFRSYRNQKRLNALLDKEKQKSDNLLLNILPIETAEELKLNGFAKAKRFDEVTVMFTDFKNFTQASEKMSAEDLVHVINFYFSEFDKIITRFNLEKIKIIGDSYMCAGGLPVTSHSHAHDAVKAALELQSFMAAQIKERQAKGEIFFELRIGINTGPVVAGIVGIKKFAYDIWGDTVNTASRMESSCEINKVNISGSTFDRVKDSFNCSYRGKIPAKHKGEIEMYFVESILPGKSVTLKQ
ncbi:MAG: adenylate/guanylate cyclase domain-containing protein [Bacteroidetes bacterium]|nr:adenylate/guanylate cyclase domain-containing protein [Bacteroidota bacterium]